MTDVYAIGEMVIDMIPGNAPASYLRRAGGAPANVAIAVAKNGLKASMACKVGNDDFGWFLMDTLKEHDVKQAVLDLTDEAITTIAFVTLHENGERVFTSVSYTHLIAGYHDCNWWNISEELFFLGKYS